MHNLLDRYKNVATLNFYVTRGLLRQFEIKPLWSSKYTIRHNQDNQRDYEELAFRAMSGMLFKNAAEQSVAPVVQTKRLKSVSGERQTNNFGIKQINLIFSIHA